MEHGLPPGIFGHGRHVTASTIDLNRLVGDGATEGDRRARHGLVVMGVYGDWVHVAFHGFADALAYNQGKSDTLQVNDGWIRPSESGIGADQIQVWFVPR